MSRSKAIATAQFWLAGGAVIFDTETTGLDGEIVEVCVLESSDGAVLLDTLVKPTCAVEDGARNVHGITDEMLLGAPLLSDIEKQLHQLLYGRPAVAYNARFDTARVGTSLKAHGLPEWGARPGGWGLDAMQLYADFAGYRRWVNLARAAFECNLNVPPTLHRARADAELARLLVHHIAGSEAHD